MENHSYQREKSEPKQQSQILECELDGSHHVRPVSRHAVIEKGERQAVEVAEAVLVRVVTVVASTLAAHTQVPLTCRDRGEKTETHREDITMKCHTASSSYLNFTYLPTKVIIF